MSILFRSVENRTDDIGEGVAGPAASFSEAADASWREAEAIRNMTGPVRMYGEARREQRERLEEHFATNGETYESALSRYIDKSLPSWERPDALTQAEQLYRDTLPETERHLVLTERELESRAEELALERVQDSRNVGRRTRGFTDTYGGMTLGDIAGTTLTDPINTLSLFAGAPAASSVLRFAIVEGFINATVEAVQQPAVQQWRAKLGLPSGWGEAFTDIATAGVGGAVLGGAAATLFRAVSKLSRTEIKEMADEFASPTDEIKAAGELLEQASVFPELNRPIDRVNIKPRMATYEELARMEARLAGGEVAPVRSVQIEPRKMTAEELARAERGIYGSGAAEPRRATIAELARVGIGIDGDPATVVRRSVPDDAEIAALRLADEPESAAHMSEIEELEREMRETIDEAVNARVGDQEITISQVVEGDDAEITGTVSEILARHGDDPEVRRAVMEEVSDQLGAQDALKIIDDDGTEFNINELLDEFADDQRFLDHIEKTCMVVA